MTLPLVILRRTWHEMRNSLRLARRQSPLKLLVVGCFAAGFEVALLLVFYAGFRFLDALGGAGTLLLNRLFALYFLGLALLLALSAAAAASGALFRTGDTAFLMTAPLPTSTVLLVKLAETARLTLWAYGFVVLPFVASYAWFERNSPAFVLWTAIFSVPLLALCAALGLLASLLIARLAPTRAAVHRLLRLLAIVAIAGVLAWLWHSQPPAAGGRPTDRFSLAAFVPGLRLATHPLLPGYWMAEGLAACRNGAWLRALLFWMTLTSSALLAGVLVEWAGPSLFLHAWNRSGSAAQRGRTPRLLETELHALLRPLAADARAILIKDLRLFCRDPLQWAQVLFAFGLLALYFGNLRTFHYDEREPIWRSFVVTLNTFSVAIVVSSLTSRFVYPQISLEGQGFWLIGLSPTPLRRVFAIKTVAAWLVVLAVTVGLVALSAHMLAVPTRVQFTLAALMALLSTSLVALASGLGATFLDLENRNPAAIVSGFGGTLNLVLSLVLIAAVLVPFGLVLHAESGAYLADMNRPLATAAAWLWAVLLCSLATVLPLRAGVRSLLRRDY